MCNPIVVRELLFQFLENSIFSFRVPDDSPRPFRWGWESLSLNSAGILLNVETDRERVSRISNNAVESR